MKRGVRDVGLGSKGDLTALKCDFRFAPDSRHKSDIASGPFSARSGLAPG